MAKQLDILLVVDIESTCWPETPPKGQTSEIIEIGITTLDLQTKKPLEKRSILVRPHTSTISPFCQELTTITQAMIDAQGIDLSEACRILKKEYNAPRRAWASWGDYDRNQFQRECRQKQIKYPFGPTHLNAKTLYSLLKGHTKEYGMARALEEMKIPLEGTHHRGDDDSWNIAKIVGKLLQK